MAIAKYWNPHQNQTERKASRRWEEALTWNYPDMYSKGFGEMK